MHQLWVPACTLTEQHGQKEQAVPEGPSTVAVCHTDMSAHWAAALQVDHKGVVHLGQHSLLIDNMVHLLALQDLCFLDCLQSQVVAC